jgi:hypothetical protein
VRWTGGLGVYFNATAESEWRKPEGEDVDDGSEREGPGWRFPHGQHFVSYSFDIIGFQNDLAVTNFQSDKR